MKLSIKKPEPLTNRVYDVLLKKNLDKSKIDLFQSTNQNEFTTGKLSIRKLLLNYF